MNHKKVIRIIAVLMASLLLLSLLASVIPVRAHADDFESQLAALNSEKDSAKQRRVAAQNKVQALKEEQAAVIDEKMALEERKEACLEEIRLIEEQIALINAEILLYDEKIAQKRRMLELPRNAKIYRWENTEPESVQWKKTADIMFWRSCSVRIRSMVFLQQ